MKRSYPYTGPGAAANQTPSQQGPSAVITQAGQVTPDYSAYGYGSNSTVMSAVSNGSSLSQEAQQAQWHQQWQQYYAQQAASGATAMNRPPQQQPQPQPQQQQQQQMSQAGQGFPQYQGGPQAPFYNQQYGQQPPMPQGPMMQNPAYAWPAATQQHNQFQSSQQAQGYVPQHFPQNNQFSQSNVGPAAKRPRFGGNNQQNSVPRPNAPVRPMNGAMGYSPGPSNVSAPVSIGPQGFPTASSPPINANWQAGNMGNGHSGMRGGPMRPAAVAPPMGGPSNMAGPMAAGPSGMRAPSAGTSDRRGVNNVARPQRPAGIPNRPGLPAMPATQGKFNGPVGVNAVTPQGRPGMAGRNTANGASGSQGGAVNSTKRIVAGMRNGIPSGPSGKGGRFDNGKGKAALTPTKGANAKGSGGFELHKALAINGKGSTIADQPVPASAKRTFSDFKIDKIQIEPIGWHWQSEALEEAAGGEEDGDEEASGAGDDETMQSINDTDSIDSSVIEAQKRLKHGKRNKDKADSNKEASRLRICFAANQPPAGAPIGPKALQSAEETEKSKVKADKEESTLNQPEWTAFSRGPPQSSTNRISISYASSRRRLVIDSDVIKRVEVNRGEQTMRIVVEVTTAAGIKKKKQMERRKGEEWVVVKGMLLEAREGEADNFGAVSRRALEAAWKKGSRDGNDEGDADEDVNALDPIPADVESAQGEAEQIDAEGEEDAEVEEKAAVDNDQEDAEEDAEAATTKEKPKANGKEETPVDIQDYSTLPPFYRLLARHDGPKEDINHAATASRELIILISLAEMSPKQEPRWIKSGDVDEWLSALPGFHSSLASVAGNRLPHAWSDKIHVLDPDPPPSLEDVLQDWSTKSFVGGLAERSKFLEEYRLHTQAGMTELLCKLIRGDRATPTPNLRDLGDPLKEVLGLSMFPQSHLTLSIVALVKMLEKYAEQSGEDSLEEKMQGIVMCLPTHQIFRACDGLLKEVLERQRLDSAARGKAAAVTTNAPVMSKKRGRESLGEEDVKGAVEGQGEVEVGVKETEANESQELKVEPEEVTFDAEGESGGVKKDDIESVEESIKEENTDAPFDTSAPLTDGALREDVTSTHDIKAEGDSTDATVSVQASAS